MARRFTALGLVVLLWGTAGGCGPSGPRTYPVSGSVTFDGQLVGEGDILFLAAEGISRPEGGRIWDGQFQFRATAGRKRVEIRAIRPIPGTSNPMRGGQPDMEDYIPTRYHSQSTLSAEIVPEGANHFDFPLASTKP